MDLLHLYLIGSMIAVGMGVKRYYNFDVHEGFLTGHGKFIVDNMWNLLKDFILLILFLLGVVLLALLSWFAVGYIFVDVVTDRD